MATSSEPITIEVEIAGRTLQISCMPGMQDQVFAAAEKVNLDLSEVTGSQNISSAELFEHLFSLTLEYLCQSNNPEDLDQENRISRLTQKLSLASQKVKLY